MGQGLQPLSSLTENHDFEVNPKSWTQHLLFIFKEEHELRTEREQKGAYNIL